MQYLLNFTKIYRQDFKEDLWIGEEIHEIVEILEYIPGKTRKILNISLYTRLIPLNSLKSFGRSYENPFKSHRIKSAKSNAWKLEINENSMYNAR